MSVLTGKLEDNTFVVMDAFALPVEGTETRVTALDEGYEYMVSDNDIGCLPPEPKVSCFDFKL